MEQNYQLIGRFVVSVVKWVYRYLDVNGFTIAPCAKVKGCKKQVKFSIDVQPITIILVLVPFSCLQSRS